jgi:hypothetical protein
VRSCPTNSLEDRAMPVDLVSEGKHELWGYGPGEMEKYGLWAEVPSVDGPSACSTHRSSKGEWSRW